MDIRVAENTRKHIEADAETEYPIDKLLEDGGYTKFGIKFTKDGKMIKMTRADL